MTRPRPHVVVDSVPIHLNHPLETQPIEGDAPQVRLGHVLLAGISLDGCVLVEDLLVLVLAYLWVFAELHVLSDVDEGDILRHWVFLVGTAQLQRLVSNEIVLGGLVYLLLGLYLAVDVGYKGD